MVKLQKFPDASHACAENRNYLRSLLYDYELYIREFHHVVTLDEFVKGWTIITPEDFGNLKPGDKVYTEGGEEFTIIEAPWISSGSYDEDMLTIEVQDYKNNTLYLEAGCVWSEPVCHEDYAWRKKYYEEEIKEWPTLIIRKKERQS